MKYRRDLLAGVGALGVALAGCSSSNDTQPAEEASPEPSGGNGTPPGTETGRKEDEMDEEPEPADRTVPADWTPPAGVWSDATYGPANTSYNPHASPPTAEPDVAWRVAVDDAPTVAVADGTVYLRRMDALTALDADDGSELWSVERGQGEVVGYVDGRLYDRTDDGLAAYTLDGEEEWETTFEGSYYDFFEREGAVYIATGQSLQVHHADTGDQLGALRRIGGPASREGVLYCVHDEDLVAFDLDGGELEERWRSPGVAAYQQFGGVAVGDDAAYLLEVDGSEERRDLLARIDTETGARAAVYHLDTVATSPAVVGDTAYVVHGQETDDGGLEGGGVVALDPGGEVWSRGARDAFGTVYATDDALVVGRTTGGTEPVRALDPANGNSLWRYGEEGEPLAVVGDTVFAVADGEFVALRG